MFSVLKQKAFHSIIKQKPIDNLLFVGYNKNDYVVVFFLYIKIRSVFL